ncbi:MAG: phosphatidate cytidylyltransferase [Clostridia bacterium]|nr:phosphatidate cytidylyltransferase [Clostridia bacterium]
MKTRLLTAVFGIPLIIFLLVKRGWLAELFIVLLAVIALYEYYGALKKANYNVFPWGAYLAAVAMWPLSRFMGVLDPLLLSLTAMLLTLTGVLVGKKPSFPDAAASIYPIFTSLMPMSMFMMMLNAVYGLVPGIALITMSFGIAYGCDAAAYFGGRLFGRHKLCPSVSPKKTVEGAVFGVGGSILVALCVRLFFVRLLSQPMPGIPATILLGLLGSVAGQVGDLTASLLKRYCGIKDYGNVFPGHGGVMDRFDSNIFVLIVLYCYTLVLR